MRSAIGMATAGRLKEAFGESACGRVPVSFRQSEIFNDLLRYLQQASIFQAKGEDELHNPFTRCVDHPGVPGHVYYEGYFHSSWKVDGPFKSINPRRGAEMDKPCAPIELLAFCECIRRCNMALTNEILASLENNQSPQARMLCSLLERNQHFAGICIPI